MSNLIIDPNGRRPMTAHHEVELNKLESAVCDWLGKHLVDSIRKAKDGRVELRLDQIKERIDQVYMLGRNHEAGS